MVNKRVTRVKKRIDLSQGKNNKAVPVLVKPVQLKQMSKSLNGKESRSSGNSEQAKVNTSKDKKAKCCSIGKEPLAKPFDLDVINCPDGVQVSVNSDD